MALKRLKFTKDWTNAADFPVYESDETKVRADQQILHNEAKNALNTLMDELENAGVLAVVQSDNLAALKYLRLNADKVLETSVDGVKWEATGSSGHIVLDKNGIALAQRARLQFANCEVSDNGTATVISGVKGDKGDIGATGVQGPQGIKGETGDTGLAIIPSVDQNTGLMSFSAGVPGAVPAAVYVKGPQGPQGVQGLQGGIGPQGVQGQQGTQGPQGTTGDTGAVGAMGPQGPQGLQGAKGDTGPRGLEGQQGPRGGQGEQGLQGPIGPTGPQGIRGDTGAKGDKGDAGPIGQTGATGAQGPQGTQGAKGAQGIPGPTGVQGAQGIQGQKGDRGLDGRSFEISDRYPTLAMLQAAFPTGTAGAFQVTANGEIYIWSEADRAWASIGALQGPQGPIGPQGTQGPQGPQGDVGPQGVQGIQGAKGDTGATGGIGPKGEKGDTGAIGATGGIGPKGEKGIQGATGLQGAKGDQGIAGPKGEKGDLGPQGVQGAKGDTGATGAQGAVGSQGIQGTKGDKGDPARVNGVLPDAAGNITLSASDVGAAPFSHVGDSSHATTAEKTAWNGKAAGTHTHPMKDLTDFPGYATKAEAEAGTDEKKLMSSLRVKQAVESSSGCVLQISFVADFAGRPYTVTAAGESYSGTVPAGLAVNVSVKNCRTTYTVEATTAAGDKYSTTITTGDYFGQYPVRLVTFTATLKVATKAGAAVTAVSGGNRYTATADGTGLATLTIRQPGTYAVDAVLGAETSLSGSIAITADGGTYNLKLAFISTILEENDWETISKVSAAGQGANYWKVGDKKKIVINGNAGKTNFSNLTIYPFILGFNHNAAVEGNGRISWQLGKNAAGDLIALVDSNYGNSVSETGWFSMNGTNTNSGGWNGSQMCNTILGSHSTPANPAPNTLLAALPPELRAVMKPCTKYRDNTGGNGDAASKVTATTEYLPLLSEFEYFGARSYANSAEQSHQKQYDYFKAGNSKIFHRHDTPATAVLAWSGSVYATGATYFCGVYSGGGPDAGSAYTARSVPPSFCT